MLTSWNGWAASLSGRTPDVLGQMPFYPLGQHLAPSVEELNFVVEGDRQGSWKFCPPCTLYETGTTLVIKANVPGLSEKNLEVSVHNNLVTLKGYCEAKLPEGYAVHCFERTPIRFSQTLALPVVVKADSVCAQLKDGVLTIELAKLHPATSGAISVRTR